MSRTDTERESLGHGLAGHVTTPGVVASAIIAVAAMALVLATVGRFVAGLVAAVR